MKKIICLTMAILFAITAFTAVGCGSSQKRDKNKTQLDISHFAGGFGEEWIYKAKEEFEAAFAETSFEEGKKGVEIWIDSNKTMLSDIQANLKAQTNTKTLYFTSWGNQKALIEADRLEDITDVYNAKVGGESRTIGDKLKIEKEHLLAAYGNGTDKYYILPHTRAIIGFVFDYDLFVQKEWLAFADDTDLDELQAQGFVVEAGETQYGTPILKFVSYSGEDKVNYVAGEAVLKAGKDGVFGTYDDGQPQDMDEWDSMITDICSAGVKPYIYSINQQDYLDPVAEAVFAQYDGIENYEITYDYSGTYVSPTTEEETVITLANGNETFKFEGRLKALEFMKENLRNAGYLHPSVDKTGRGALDVQKEFVLGYTNTDINPTSAMLVEGTWWENECKTLFNSLAEDGQPERGFGKRDYRYMLYPKFENQKGVDGNGNGSVFSSFEDAMVFINKAADSASKNAAKEFIKFIRTDEWLAKFTSMTGGVMPYDYTLTDEQYDGLTDFKKCVWNIYYDEENYKIVTPNFMFYSQLINYNSLWTAHRWSTKIGKFDYMNTILGLKSNSAQDYYDGMVTYYSDENWQKLVDGLN